MTTILVPVKCGVHRLLCRHQIFNSKHNAGRANGVESGTGITGIQHLNRHSAEPHPPTMLLTWPFWESSPKPCPAPAQRPSYESKSPCQKGKSQTQEAAISTRMQLSFLHLGCSRYLACSLPSFSCTAQVATLAPCTWKSQTIVYLTIASKDKDETPSSTARHIVLLLVPSLVVACLLFLCT
jgi:hypothetical protein